MRKSITSLLSAATMAVALIGGSLFASPGTAEAAGCAKWQRPHKVTIKQSNGIMVTLVSGKDGWRASHGRTVSTEVVFRATRYANHERFIITWSNHTAGVYDGIIDDEGFATGFTYDRLNPSAATAKWTMGRLYRCVGR